MTFFGRPSRLVVLISFMSFVTFFRNDALEFYWRDPEPVARTPIEIPEPERAWRAHHSSKCSAAVPHASPAETPTSLSVEQLDLSIRVHPVVATFLFEENWQRAREVARELRSELYSSGYQPDGLSVIAGARWSHRLELPFESG